MSRSRRAIVAFALIASLLVVSATPAAASHGGPVVVSTHTTDTDFGDATLTNMTVNGTGEAATVKLSTTWEPTEISDIWSWYDAGEISAAEGADVTTWEDIAGTYNLSQSTAAEKPHYSTSAFASGAVQFDGSDDDMTTAAYSTSLSQPFTIIFVAKSTQASDTIGFIGSSAGSYINPRENQRGADDQLLYAGANQYITGASGDSNKHIETYIGNGGSSKIRRDGSQTGSGNPGSRGYNELRIADSSSPWAGHVAEIIIYDKELNSTELGDVEAYLSNKYGISGPTGDDVAPPAEYLNNHSATNTVQGFANISSANNVTITATWRGDSNGDGTYDTLLNQTTGITSAGNHSFMWSEFSGDDVQVNLTVESTGTNEAFEMEGEGVLATNDAPTVDNSSASPTGALQTATPTLSIDINDFDFGTGNGDSVDVKFYVDGVLEGTDTLTSNGTAQQSISALDGGDHTWHVQAVDSFGHTQTSQTFTMSTPGNLTIRRELAPDELVTDAQVNITGYYSGEVIRRSDTDSDGNISLSGFPLDEPIVVRATADGYYTRTAVIVDVFEQNSVYLLNSSVATYRVRFDLQDPTGQYDRSDTVLFIDRDLNVSGSVEWRVIAGDDFGIQGVPVDLAQEERYRLRIKNLETGDTATLGSFTAIQDETVTLSPGAATLVFEDIEREFTWEARENETSQKIIVEYAEESSSNTADVKITIHERFNKSNVLVNNQSYSSVNSLVFEQSLTNDEVNKTWSLVLYVDRGDGFVRYGPEPIGGGPRDLIPVELDAVWRTAIGVFVLLISSMAFSELNTGVGVVATALIGGLLWFIGLLALVATGPAVVFAIAIALAYQYRSGAGV